MQQKLKLQKTIILLIHNLMSKDVANMFLPMSKNTLPTDFVMNNIGKPWLNTKIQC